MLILHRKTPETSMGKGKRWIEKAIKMSSKQKKECSNQARRRGFSE
jgi:hypothetical protein